MYKLNPLPPAIDPRLLKLLVQAEPAVIGHFRYTGFMSPDIRAYFQDRRVAGTAITIRMPGMDGVEATRRIRELPAHGHTPIIALTANVLEEQQQKCLEVGMNGFITKPIDPALLYRTIAENLPGFHAPAPGPVPSVAPSSAGAWQNLPEALRNSPVIDARQGLRNTGADAAFYLSLLVRFANVHGNNPAVLATRITQDVHAAAHALHALKGAAATLGLNDVAWLAEKTESALLPGAGTDPAAPRPEALEAARSAAAQLETALQSTLQAIRSSCTPSSGDLADGTSAPQADWRAPIRQLLHWLETDNTQALDDVQAQASMLRQVFGKDAETLLMDIENFEYPAAARRVQTWLARAD